MITRTFNYCFDRFSVIKTSINGLSFQAINLDCIVLHNYDHISDQFFFTLKYRIIKCTIFILISAHAPSANPGPEVIKHFSCSAQLRRKFALLIKY